MSKYSSDSDDNDCRGKSTRRKRRRKAMSESSSSRDSYVKSSKRRSHKSRSHSRDSYRTPSKNSYKDKRSSLKDKSRSQRSRSPYRNRSRSRRRYRSTSSSRSRSRTSSNSYAKKKSYSKSKRKYKSRSRSRSRHRKSRSHSRRRSRSKQKYRSRSRSSSSTKKHKRSSIDRNGHDRSSSSDDSLKLDGKHLQELQRRIQKDVDSKKNIKQEPLNSYTPITIPSDDPIVKQEQLDDINASSFTPKAFKSSKNCNRPDENPLLSTVKLENELNNLRNNNLGDGLTIVNDNGDEKRKNDTVFHDSIAFEDSEHKIQKWVKKLFTLRQKFLYGYSNWDKRES